MEYTIFGPTNPFRDLSKLGSNLKADIKFGGVDTPNLEIVQAIITNKGSAPILPSDFYEGLSLNVQKPWRIVGVMNNEITSLPLSWRRVSDQKFATTATLFNPNDVIWVNVYLTNPDKNLGGDLDERASPRVTWGGRIINLQSLSKAPDIFKSVHAPKIIAIELQDYGILFVVISFVIYESLYILMIRSFFNNWENGFRCVTAVILTSLISLAAAESSSTFFFPNIYTMMGIDYGINLPWIVANFIALSFVGFHYLKKHSRLNQSKSESRS